MRNLLFHCYFFFMFFLYAKRAPNQSSITLVVIQAFHAFLFFASLFTSAMVFSLLFLSEFFFFPSPSLSRSPSFSFLCSDCLYCLFLYWISLFTDYVLILYSLIASSLWQLWTVPCLLALSCVHWFLYINLFSCYIPQKRHSYCRYLIFV